MSKDGYYGEFPHEGYPGDGPNSIRLKHSEPVAWGRKQTILAWFWTTLALIGAIILFIVTSNWS